MYFLFVCIVLMKTDPVWFLLGQSNKNFVEFFKYGELKLCLLLLGQIMLENIVIKHIKVKYKENNERIEFIPGDRLVSKFGRTGFIIYVKSSSMFSS